MLNFTWMMKYFRLKTRYICNLISVYDSCRESFLTFFQYPQVVGHLEEVVSCSDSNW